jgi:hypothetical protein
MEIWAESWASTVVLQASDHNSRFKERQLEVEDSPLPFFG